PPGARAANRFAERGTFAEGNSKENENELSQPAVYPTALFSGIPVALRRPPSREGGGIPTASHLARRPDDERANQDQPRPRTPGSPRHPHREPLVQRRRPDHHRDQVERRGSTLPILGQGDCARLSIWLLRRNNH